MHSILALTLMHDRSLASTTTPLSRKEAFHYYRGVSLFNARLSGPVPSAERDALWAAAMGLGVISFFHIEAQTPAEAWPLTPESNMDLNWLKMIEGKQIVWRFVGPPSKNSLFDQPYPENIKSQLPPQTNTTLHGLLPPEFIALYELDRPSSTDGENPYRSGAVLLGQSLAVTDLLPVLMAFLTFLGNISPEYKRLLEQKDGRALLLLAYWYAKVSCFGFKVWWVERRANLEGQAICIFLERFYGDFVSVMSLLDFPKMVLCAQDGT